MKENNQFKALLDELETMSKAHPNDGADDKRIEAAAGENGGGENGGGEGGENGQGKDGKETEEPFGKSFKVMVDGKEVEAFDGTEMMKSLWTRNQALETSVATLTEQNQDLGDALTKSLELVKGLHGTVNSQGDMLKSMRADLDALRNQGTGRKTTVSVLDKPAPTTMAKAFDGIAPRELLSKALTAQREGRMTASQVARVEAHVNRGEAPPKALLDLALGNG
ncbi:hypothetical protein [Azospirillum sp.]|uniref:hypothetical protein n=1 Tax=Azospirillum sp. TaxID=34012 RepID=UPI003D72368C